MFLNPIAVQKFDIESVSSDWFIPTQIKQFFICLINIGKRICHCYIQFCPQRGSNLPRTLLGMLQSQGWRSAASIQVMMDTFANFSITTIISRWLGPSEAERAPFDIMSPTASR